MGKDITIDDFYTKFMEEIHMAMETETYGWENQDFFTVVMLESLEEAGEIEDPIICPFRGYGLQLNAYKISDDFETVNIFVSLFNDAETLISISKTDISAVAKRGIEVYRKATNDLYKAFEKDSDTYEFAITLHDHCEDIKNVNIIVLTNGKVKTDGFKNTTINGTNIAISIWDIDRLYRCATSGKMRETVEIDFPEMFGISIPCIENKVCEKYSTYLAIVSGDLLANIYELYGPRLLERNVRSFLQVKGAVNKGIRDTLRDAPDMFLAYNNGISVTAEKVEIVYNSSGAAEIKKIRDMQIVNGGQTTASIYNARKDKKIKADLSKVFVQMKLTEIASEEDMDTMVPQISACANTQNKVQIADFSANDPFHRKIEDISRVTWAPGKEQRNWFYERARGQYADMLSKEGTVLRRKHYKETHPVFTKTDLAKYECTWEQLPYQVSEGAQKNFKKFTLRLIERGNFIPDNQYYERLIAKAILFRSAEKLVQQQQYGGYRANIVTYTIAYLSYKTAQRIDLYSIWKEQRISQGLENAIIDVSQLIHDAIVNPPNGANISEWCKKQQCWEKIKNIAYILPESLERELIDIRRAAEPVVSSARDSLKSSFNTATEDEIQLITRASKISAGEWYSLSKWSKDTDNFQGWQRGILFSVGQLVARGRKPSYKQAKQALLVYDEARQKGFNYQS